MVLRKVVVATSLCALLSGCGTYHGVGIQPIGALGAFTGTSRADLYEAGRKNLYAGNIALALEAFKLDIARNGDSVRSLNGIAICYDLLGRHEIATNYFDRARSLDPSSPVTRGNIAVSEERSQAAAATLAAEAPVEAVPAVPIVKVERMSAIEWRITKVAPTPEVAPPAAAPAPALANAPTVEDVANAFTQAAADVPTAAPALANAPTVEAVANAFTQAAAEVPTAAPEVVANTVTQATADVPAVKLAAVPVRVVNGTGRTRMARRIASHLADGGITVTRLSNASRYNHRLTVIEYSAAFERDAQEIAARLPAHVALRRNDRMAGIEVTLGTDLAKFDASLNRGARA